MPIFPLEIPHFQHNVSYKGNGSDYYANTTEVAIGIANSWTVACWVKVTQAVINDRIWEIKAAAGNTNRLTAIVQGTTGQVQFLNFTSGAGAIKNFVYNGVLSPNNWTHIVFSWDGTTLLAYFNGLLKAADTLTTNNAGTMTDTSRAVAFGAQISGNSAFNGTTHSMQIWNTVLTAAEVALLFNNGNGASFNAGTVQNSSLKHWWMVERGDSSRGQDYGNAATPIDISTNGIFTAGVGRINDAPRQIIQTSVYPGHKYCIDFDGSTEWMRNATVANNGPNVLDIANEWTVAMWIKPTESTFASARTILGFGIVSGNSRIQLQHEGNVANDPFGIITSNTAGGVLRQYRYNNMINADQAWQHICVTWDGTNLVTYSNGAAVTADTTTDNAGTMVKAARVIQFGALAGANFWLGRLHSVAVWSTVLTAGQAASLYNGGRGWDYDIRLATPTFSPIHWWLFGDPNIGTLGLAYDRIDSQVSLYGTVIDPAAMQATSLTIADDSKLDAPGL